MDVKKIGIGAVIAGSLSAATLGLGAGVAAADQPLLDSPGVTFKLDRPAWKDWDGEGGEGRDWNGWRGEPGWNGPQYGACVWVPPAVSAWVPPAVC
jgi:hypothetical protein